jgi:poly(3-hydroxybutyrate) depolymerase
VSTPTSFTVATFGAEPLSYQWRLDGRELLDQTNQILRLNAVQPADEGDYTVKVTNAFGAALSTAARLYVVPRSTNWIRSNFTNAAGLRLPYFYFLPANYDSTRTYPLVCQFHGSPASETTWDSTLATRPQTLVFGSYKQQITDPAIVVWPMRRVGDNDSWTDQYLRQVLGLVDWLVANLKVDTNRVYVAGGSEGGHAAWDLLGLRPGFFAAARILAGWQGNTPAASIKDVPLWAFHAADDVDVGVDSSRNLIRALRQAGGRPLYTEYSSGGHLDGIGQAQCTPAAVDWFLAQRRGVGSAVGPLLSITSPTKGIIHTTGATNITLVGSAEAPDQYVTRVTWENLANRVRGDAAGTNVWRTTEVLLAANKTNIVVVTATTASWAPAFGGNTTFNDTLAVLCLPIRATLALQGSDQILNWTGGVPPYRVQKTADLVLGDWTDILSNVVPPVPLPLKRQAEFYRIIGQ